MSLNRVQQALAGAGFDCGPLDGLWGPRMRAAVKAFQTSRGLQADGVVGPRTIAAMGLVDRADASSIEPVWVLEGRRRLGLHEKADNAELRAFLRSDGRTLGDPIRLPWCGDFVETCIRLALAEEATPANPYLARNWLAFGVATPPVVGAVAVFWRGSRTGSSGHVGFVVGADMRFLSILGGNQSNSVTVSRLSRDRLLGCRWPTSAGPVVSTAMPGAVGAVTTNEA